LNYLYFTFSLQTQYSNSSSNVAIIFIDIFFNFDSRFHISLKKMELSFGVKFVYFKKRAKISEQIISRKTTEYGVDVRLELIEKLRTKTNFNSIKLTFFGSNWYIPDNSVFHELTVKIDTYIIYQNINENLVENIYTKKHILPISLQIKRQ
jgi:hypothetical protein